MSFEVGRFSSGYFATELATRRQDVSAAVRNTSGFARVWLCGLAIAIASKRMDRSLADVTRGLIVFRSAQSVRLADNPPESPTDLTRESFQ